MFFLAKNKNILYSALVMLKITYARSPTKEHLSFCLLSVKIFVTSVLGLLQGLLEKIKIQRTSGNFQVRSLTTETSPVAKTGFSC